jgi:hypothetical protein
MTDKPSMKTIVTNKHHKALMTALKEAIFTHGMELTPVEWLAIASQFVGSLIAAQDSRTHNNEEVMELIIANIEQGNREFIAAVVRIEGGLN